MPPGRLTLGPFALTVPIARGAMGEVWRAVHVARELPVAVKLLTAERQRDAAFARVFRTEVERMARLDHRHIIMVLDHGQVPEGTADASEGRLAAGSPWLAMEYAAAGSLAGAGPAADWTVVSARLRALLAALAHAHAHGILHRDLKPENVLLSSAGDLRPGLKLADFGIATSVDAASADGDALFAGTPAYMAPEQIRGERRWLGPWTDLYALGALAWAQSTSRLPFDPSETQRVLQAHLTREPGRFDTHIQVPTGLEEWVRRLLLKDPTARFPSAIDALAALEALDGGTARLGGGAGLPTTEPVRTADTWSFDEAPLAGPTLDGGDSLTGRDQAGATAGRHDLGPRPSLPETPWSTDGPPPPRLLGAGLGLYRLRPPPLVGRRTTMQALWTELRRIWAEGGTHCAVLAGPRGMGKSRLATWLGTRAEELGAGVSLHVRGDAGGDALQDTVARWLRCAGLLPKELRQHLARVLRGGGHPDPDEESAALAAWLGGATGTAAAPATAALLERTFDALRRARPVVLVVDQDGAEGPISATLGHLLRGTRLPLLVVVTDEQPEPAARNPALQHLEAMPCATRHWLGPLPDADMGALIQRLLVLDADLARSVRVRASGSPLFAVQLVGDWVRRGVLRPTDEGFRLPDGEPPRIPDDIHALWLEAVGHAVGALPASDGRALRMAAVGALGRGAVDIAEWTRACAPSPGPSEALLASLGRGGLATEDAGTLAFAHALLVESLTRDARERGEEASAHARWADLLTEHTGTPRHAERLGLHRLRAGQAGAAVDPLIAGADAAHRRDRALAAGALLTAAEDAMSQADVPVDDGRRGQIVLLRVRVRLGQGDLTGAARDAARLAQRARRRGWPAIQATALRYRGMALGKSGDLTAAEATLRKALGAAEQAALPGETAASRMHLATLARMRGEREAAHTLLLAAQEGFDAAGDTLQLAECLTELAGLHVTLGDPAEGAARAREAASLFALAGNRTGEGLTRNTLGDALRRLGQPASARKAFGEAQTLLRRTGSHARVFPQLNLALLDLDEGQPDVAADTLDDVLLTAGRLGDRVVEAYGTVFLAAAKGQIGEWAAAGALLQTAEDLLAETGLAEPDIARHLRALAAGSPDAAVAARADDLAADQEDALQPGR